MVMKIVKILRIDWVVEEIRMLKILQIDWDGEDIRMMDTLRIMIKKWIDCDQNYH